MAGFGTGFSVLAWVKDDCIFTQNLETLASERMQRELLTDFCTLLNFRWTMDISLTTIEGTLYAFGTNARITVSERTVKLAIGELANHIDILRGTISASAEDLHRYRACKRKWKVPDVTSDTSSGWDRPEQAGTSTPIKRARF